MGTVLARRLEAKRLVELQWAALTFTTAADQLSRIWLLPHVLDDAGECLLAVPLALLVLVDQRGVAGFAIESTCTPSQKRKNTRLGPLSLSPVQPSGRRGERHARRGMVSSAQHDRIGDWRDGPTSSLGP